MAQQSSRFDSKLLENFEIIDVKCGKFSTLYTVAAKGKGSDSDAASEIETQFALKVVGIKRFIPTAKKLALKQFSERLQKIRNLSHPNVICYFATWYENPPLSFQYPGMQSIAEKQKLLFLQMEYCDLNSLRGWLHSPWRNERDSWIIASQIAHGLGYLHDAGLIHGNLKPENVLMSLGQDEDLVNVKVTDYGLKSHGLHKPRYASPEAQFPSNGSKLSSKSDSYSFGVILAELIFTTRDLSFTSENFSRFLTSKDTFCLKNYVNFYPSNMLGNEELSLLSSLTSSSPKARPTTTKILHFVSQLYPTVSKEPLTPSSFLPWRMTKDHCNIDNFLFLPSHRCLALTELDLDLTLSPDIELLQTLPQIRKLPNLSKLSLRLQHLLNLELIQKLSLPKLQTFRLQIGQLETHKDELEQGYKFLARIFRFFSPSQVQRNLMTISLFLNRFELLYISVQESVLRISHSSLVSILDILSCTEFHEIGISVPVEVLALPDYLCEIESFCERLSLKVPTTLPFVFPYIYGFPRLTDLSLSLSSGEFPPFDLSLIPETLKTLKLARVDVFISEDNEHVPRQLDYLSIKNCKHPDGFWELLERNFIISDIKS